MWPEWKMAGTFSKELLGILSSRQHVKSNRERERSRQAMWLEWKMIGNLSKDLLVIDLDLETNVKSKRGREIDRLCDYNGRWQEPFQKTYWELFLS